MYKALVLTVLCFVLSAVAQFPPPPPPPTWCTMEMGWVQFPPETDEMSLDVPSDFSDWIVGSIEGWFPSPVDIIQDVVCDMQNVMEWVDIEMGGVLQDNSVRYRNDIFGDFAILSLDCKFGATGGYVEFTDTTEFFGMPFEWRTLHFKQLSPTVSHGTYTFYISPWEIDAVGDVLDAIGVTLTTSLDETVLNMATSNADTEFGRIYTLVASRWDEIMSCFGGGL